MAEIKTEYGRGILKGIALVHEAFVKFTLENPDKRDGMISVPDLIGFITAFRAGVAQAIEKAEAEGEVKAE